MLQKCAYALISQQELSAQQVASYLMDWEDHFTSHTYRNFYWTAFESFINKELESPECYPSKGVTDAMEPVNDEPRTRPERDDENEVEHDRDDNDDDSDEDEPEDSMFLNDLARYSLIIPLLPLSIPTCRIQRVSPPLLPPCIPGGCLPIQSKGHQEKVSSQ
ncbi:hypothetical protein B0H11DRAFT_1939526 [Mycena galericulata]|nr:hypothetical protein B0H11DRAFT_1939526 [Mycena galericulata]